MRTGAATPLAGAFAPPSAAEWRALAEKLAGPGGLAGLATRTDDGIVVAPLYAPSLGDAPSDPSSAGGWPTSWEVAQPHMHPDPAEAGRQAREDLAAGAGSVVIRLDRALARGSTRPDGVLAYDAAALERLLAELPAAPAAVRLEAGEHALDRLADLERLGQARGPDAAAAWSVLADPVAAALEGAPGDPAPRLAASVAALAGRPMLRLVADGRPWHEAGASEAQEIAGALASAVLWLRTGEAVGVAPSTVLGRLELVLSVDDDLFLSLAKLRAARLALGRILEAAGLAEAGRGVPIRAETSRRMTSRLDPWVNVPRTTVAALAAVAGGADALTVHPFDRPLGQASGLARRIARNVQLVLREEAGVGRVRDPAAGAWYVAHLTRALAEAAWARLQRIEGEGGLLAALRTGTPQAEVAATRRARAERVARGAIELTGVSAFPTLQERPPPAEPADPGAALEAARAALARRPRAVEAPPFPELWPIRLAEPFERLRARAAAAAARQGDRPSVPVAGLGRPAELHELVNRVENLLATGGLAARRLGSGSPAEAASAVSRDGAPAAIACVGAGAAGRAGELVDALRAAGARRVWLTGAAEAVAVGAERLVPGLDLVAFLEELHGLLGTPEVEPGESP